MGGVYTVWQRGRPGNSLVRVFDTRAEADRFVSRIHRYLTPALDLHVVWYPLGEEAK